MEYTNKMILLQLDDYEKILKIALKLAKNNGYNEELNIRVDNEFKKDTNILDYILGKGDLKHKKHYDDYINDLATKVSPIKLKQKPHNIKQKSKTWISIK